MGLALDRRRFLEMCGGAMLTMELSACRAMPAAPSAYSVTALGDMHYDAFPPEKFHAAAIAKWLPNGAHPIRLKEFERNAQMWQGVCQRILAASASCMRDDAAFVLQLGDLVQGDCESDVVHGQMLAEAMGLLEQTYRGLPVVSPCGNHDIREGDRNEGAADAYADFMLPYVASHVPGRLPQGAAATTYGFRQGPDLWVVLDFNFGKRDAAIVRRLLAENPDVRYTFIATHGPVLPMHLWKCRWFYLGKMEETQLRREMRALFARRQAIVLAGHAHSLELKDWYGDGGRITEMVINTCAGKEDGGCYTAEPQVQTEDPADYGAWAYGVSAEKLGPHAHPAKNAVAMAALFNEYRNGLRRHYSARAVGHHILNVSDAGVTLDYFGHDATVPMRTFTLR